MGVLGVITYSKLVFGLLLVVFSVFVSGDVAEVGIGVGAAPGQLDSQICVMNRSVIVSPGRLGSDAPTINILNVRGSNYGFTGEEMEYYLVIRDPNGALDIGQASITVNGNGEVLCNPTELPESCEGLRRVGAMQGYSCSPGGSDFAFVDGNENGRVDNGEVAYGTIQEAVDVAVAGELVCVARGTYREQVVINKDLRVWGAVGSVVSAPASVGRQTYTIPESGSTWDPIVFGFGGNEAGGVVTGSGTVDIEIHGLSIDGLQDWKSGARFVGVLLRNVGGRVEDNMVGNFGVNGVETFGIIVYGDSELLITGNDVSGFSRGGIGGNGDLDGGLNWGPLPDPVLEITDNVVTGPWPTHPVWAPNGIQVGYNATGLIKDNIVRNNKHVQMVSSGIIVVDTSNVVVENNQVTDNDQGMNIGSFFGNPADDNVVINNLVDGNLWGIIVFNGADGTKVMRNIVTNQAGDGVDVFRYGVGYPYPTGTNVTQNNIFGNGGDGLWTDLPGVAPGPVFAEWNYWGSGFGPNHVSNPGGTGDSVTGEVDVIPFSPIAFGITVDIPTHSPTDERVDGAFHCLLTFEPSDPDTQENVGFVVRDSLGGVSSSLYSETWTVNPVISLNVYTSDGNPITFEDGGPGDYVHSSNKLLVENTANQVNFWMFVAASDLTDSTGAGKCPVTNKIDVEGSQDDTGLWYRARSGTLETANPLVANPEGWAHITNPNQNLGCDALSFFWRVVDGTDQDTLCQGAKPMFSSDPLYNVLTNGGTAEIEFKLLYPVPCVGAFDQGKIFVFGKPI